MIRWNQISKAVCVMAAVVCAAGTAQALILENGTFTEPTIPLITAPTFSVSGAGSLFSESTTVRNADDQGIGFLTGPGYSNTFALTDAAVGTLTKSFLLTTPGTYTFKFDFANEDSHAGDKIQFVATVTAVPEAQPYAMLLAGLLVLGVYTGRERFWIMLSRNMSLSSAPWL